MLTKKPLTIQDQLDLLQARNMQFKEIADAPHFLANISYYRLKERDYDARRKTYRRNILQLIRKPKFYQQT